MLCMMGGDPIKVKRSYYWGFSSTVVEESFGKVPEESQGVRHLQAVSSSCGRGQREKKQSCVLNKLVS